MRRPDLECCDFEKEILPYHGSSNVLLGDAMANNYACLLAFISSKPPNQASHAGPEDILATS